MVSSELISILLLMIVPLVTALFLAIIKKDSNRSIVVGISSTIIIIASIFLASIAFINKGSLEILTLNSSASLIGWILFSIEIIVSVIIIALSLKHHKILPLTLGIIQVIALCYLEYVYHSYTQSITNEIPLITINNISAIMILIIGIVGTIICIYALGYIKNYHNIHTDIPNRKQYFFVIIFVFLSAMFGLVISNSLMWILCFWEITTLCSFLLIGYSNTAEAINNSFRALWMNLIGGIAFTLAIISILRIDVPKQDLTCISNILSLDPQTVALTIPLMLIAVAGLTKAAQLPFSSWLTGAMVAPTPVSALLHSSTMVKAGVYILIIFAPLFSKTQVGVILAIIGAFTFLVTAMLAISQSNAKKVLAYSTISNLGLITACAGVGTDLAITAAVLLVIFHAVSKALLFMCVGTVEHKIGSRDIEDMDSLISRLPLLATMMVIGICGMYLAPFGMLISKWATIVAFMESSYGWVLVTLMAFGSAFTIFFWTKWLGNLFMRITNQTKMVDVSINISEKIAVIATSVLTLLCCIFYPIIGSLFTKDPADLAFSILNPNNILMVTIMFSILVIMILASYFGIKSHEKIISPYLCGRSVDENGQFYGSLGTYKVAHSSNYYLEEFCGEKILLSPACIISVILIVIMIISAIMGIVII